MNSVIDTKLFMFGLPLVWWTITIPFHNHESLFLTTLSSVSMFLMMAIMIVTTVVSAISIVATTSIYNEFVTDMTNDKERTMASVPGDILDAMIEYADTLKKSYEQPRIYWSMFLSAMWFFGFVAVGWAVPAVLYLVMVASMWTVRAIMKSRHTTLLPLLDEITAYRNSDDPSVVGEVKRSSILLA